MALFRRRSCWFSRAQFPRHRAARLGDPNVGAAISDGSLRIVARTGHVSESHGGGRDVPFRLPANDAEDLLRDALALLPASRKAALLVRFLRSTAARLLRASETELDENAGSLSSGLNSLRALELKHAINSLLRADVPLSLLLSDISFAALAEKLVVPDFGAASTSEGVPGDRAPSFTQRAMWTVHQLKPAGAAYNLHLALRIMGPLDEAMLRASFEDVLERHATLRSVYEVENGELVVSVRPGHSLDGWFSVVDAIDWPDEALRGDMARAAATPFDLENGPVLRARLYGARDGQPTLLLCAHHIALDLWSLLIVLNETRIAYAARRGRREAALPELPSSYHDFAAWQRGYIESAAGVRDWEYWQERLGGDLPVLALPLDRSRGSEQQYEGSSVCRLLDARTTAMARNVAQSNGVTLFVFFLAVYEIVLYRYTHQRDLIIGTASSGRSQGRFKGVVGNFVNPLALRTRLTAGAPFSVFLREVQDSVRQALAHQDFPFSEIVERLRPERVEGRWPIFQTWFALQQAQSDMEESYAQLALGEDTGPLPWGELAISGVGLDERIERFDLKLMAAEAGDGIGLSFQYRRDLFDAATIARIRRLFRIRARRRFGKSRQGGRDARAGGRTASIDNRRRRRDARRPFERAFAHTGANRRMGAGDASGGRCRGRGRDRDLRRPRREIQPDGVALAAGRRRSQCLRGGLRDALRRNHGRHSRHSEGGGRLSSFRSWSAAFKGRRNARRRGRPSSPVPKGLAGAVGARFRRHRRFGR